MLHQETTCDKVVAVFAFATGHNYHRDGWGTLTVGIAHLHRYLVPNPYRPVGLDHRVFITVFHQLNLVTKDLL